MFSSLRFPLVLSMFVLTTLAIISTSTMMLEQVQESYLAVTRSNLRRDCEFLANLMRRHMDQVALTPTARKRITDEMKHLSLQMSGRLCIVNWKGQVLEDSAGRTGQNLTAQSEVVSALHGEAAAVEVGLDGETEPRLRMAVPMLAKDRVVGAIYAERSLLDLTLLTLSLQERALQAGLAMLAVSLLLSLLLGFYLSAPLRRLNRGVRSFGGGNLKARVRVRGSDEVGQLAASFNAMADSLERNQGILLQFVSDASHELKTPLTSLRSLVEAMEGGAGLDPATAERFWSLIHRELDRMERLVKDLLRLQRLEQVPPAPGGPTRLDELLESLRCEYAQRCPLTIECPRVELACDPERLRQLLVILVENALRAVADEPEPRVVVGYRQGVVFVEDNGIGLASHHLERVFDRFYRVDEARSRNDGGSGLGLAIARSLVASMGGTISCHSDGPGRGVRVSIQLEEEGCGHAAQV